MEFKYILKDLREENGISQKQLAKECGLSPQCISALEKGINSPTFQTLSALKKYFGNQLNDYFVNNEITSEERKAGASEKKKISITPIEDEMLYLFREIGKKHGEQAQQALITVAEKML